MQSKRTRKKSVSKIIDTANVSLSVGSISATSSYVGRMNLPPGNICCWFDGACEPRNPGGNMGIGACIRIGGKEVFSHSKFVGANPNNSNNVAEYMGLEAILDYILQENWQGFGITIYGDSKLVIEQMFGNWRMKGGRYVQYAVRCQVKLRLLSEKRIKVTGIWIRREQNSYADELSKKELINNNVEFRIQPLSTNPLN